MMFPALIPNDHQEEGKQSTAFTLFYNTENRMESTTD